MLVADDAIPKNHDTNDSELDDSLKTKAATTALNHLPVATQSKLSHVPARFVKHVSALRSHGIIKARRARDHTCKSTSCNEWCALNRSQLLDCFAGS